MPTEILTKHGTQLCFRDSTDFSPSAANDWRVGTPTYVQFDCTSLAAGETRASAKSGSIGATHAKEYSVHALIESALAPSDAGRFDFYWASSPSATAANANAGGLNGTDTEFTETVGIFGQFQKIGSLYVRANTINAGFVGVFSPTELYGQLIMHNATDQSTVTGTNDQSHVVMRPLIDELQD